MKRTILCLALALLLGLSPAAFAEGGEEDPWAAAFDGTARLRLTPVPLNVEALAGENQTVRLLDISPDGKTLLCAIEETITIEPEVTESRESQEGTKVRRSTPRGSMPGLRARTEPRTETTLCLGLVRDGVLTPVGINAEKGDGNPYGALETVQDNLPWRPATGVFSWSADGRYVTFSNIEQAWSGGRTLQVPVVDTAAAEMWLADSYPAKAVNEEGYGLVFLNRMSRDGTYVYYLLTEVASGQRVFRFCRCAPEGGGKEVLWEMPFSGNGSFFSLMSSTDLIETADGSWLLTCTAGDRTLGKVCTMVVRFAPLGPFWTAEMRSTGIPIGIYPKRFTRSAASEYGVILMRNVNATQARLTSEGEPEVPAWYGLSEHVNLLRILPGEDFAFDSWYLQRTGEDPSNLAFVSGSEYLRYIQAMLSGYASDPPAGYDPRKLMNHPLPMISRVCLSPDGRYALLAVTVRNDDLNLLFCLVRLETMEIRTVDAGKDYNAEYFAMDYSLTRTDITWNPDGTLLIQSSSDRLEAFRLEVW